MARIVTQFDIDLALIQQRTAQLRQVWRQAAADARAANLANNLTHGMNGGGGGGGGRPSGGRPGGGLRGLGGAGMQLQDVAVQAQMGTSAAVIIGQQGSQLLGALGPGGAIAGAAIAVGAAFVTMGQKGKAQFEELKKETKEFGKEVENLLAAGDADALAAGYGKIEERLKSLNQVATDGYSVWGRFKGALAQAMGSVSVDEKDKAVQDAQVAAIEAAYKVQKEAIAVSKNELEIVKARAAGEMEKVRLLERAKELNKEIAKIEASKLPASVKEKLKEDAIERDAIEGKSKEDKIFLEEGDKKQKAILGLQDEIKKRQTEALPPLERARVMGDDLRQTLRKGNEANPTMAGLDEKIKSATDLGEKERLLGLKKTAMEQEKALRDLAPKPSDTIYQGKGDFGKAAGFLSGGNPNDLIAVSIKDQALKVAEGNKLLTEIREILKVTRPNSEPTFD